MISAQSSRSIKASPGGALLLYVPAFHCLWSTLDDKVCHCRRYAKENSCARLSGQSFRSRSCNMPIRSASSPALTFRLLRKDATLQLTAKSIAWYDKWIFPLSRMLDILFHRFLREDTAVSWLGWRR